MFGIDFFVARLIRMPLRTFVYPVAFTRGVFDPEILQYECSIYILTSPHALPIHAYIPVKGLVGLHFPLCLPRGGVEWMSK